MEHRKLFRIVLRDERDKRVPVTTAWRVLSLRMEKRPPIWRVAANILNKQSRKGVVLQLGGWARC